MNHLSISKKEIQNATLACITGDPHRVEQITTEPGTILLEKTREFTIALTHLEETPVVIASHGIGGSSLEILVEELSQIGVCDFLRIGTSGAIQPTLSSKEVIISQASVRLDGVSPFYAPVEVPAVSDYRWVHYLEQAAITAQISYHVGITASTASFYAGQERYDTKRQIILPKWQGSMKQWEQLGILNYEMESASLFILGTALGLRVGCITGIVAERTSQEALFSSDSFQLAWKVGWIAIQLWIKKNRHILQENMTVQ